VRSPDFYIGRQRCQQFLRRCPIFREARSRVVPNEQQARITIRTEMEKLVELNERQHYTYDRDTLVKMLDEALDRTRPGP
jgi:hypothetical protein